jgi:hypothetical protein
MALAHPGSRRSFSHIADIRELDRKNRVTKRTLTAANNLELFDHCAQEALDEYFAEKIWLQIGMNMLH